MSSDGHIKEISEDVVAVRDQLTADLKSEKRRTIIIGVLLIIINVAVFLGFSRAHGFIRDFVTPKSVAELAESELSRVLPDLGQSLSRSLKASAPQLAELVKNKLLREALPALRRQGEEQLIGLADAAITVAEQEMEATVGSIITHAKAEVLAAAATEAATAPDALARTLRRVVDQELRQRLTDRPGEPLAVQLEQARRQLLAINEKLKRLASGKGLSRQETLQRRLIESWIGLVEQKVQGPCSPARSGATPHPARTPARARRRHGHVLVTSRLHVVDSPADNTGPHGSAAREH